MYLSGERNGLTYVTATETNAPVFTPLSEFPFRAPHRLFFNPYDVNEVWVTTFGNGMYVGHTTGVPTSAEANVHIPLHFDLKQNFPNPFNPVTTIQFTIPSVGTHENASRVGTTFQTFLRLYDVLGKEVATLVDEVKEPGTYSVRFDGSKLSSGIYFYTLQTGNFTATKKLVLMK
ncbi:MAG: T9SS type A sorting domain-containing protein [Ignavibacteriales bacterium]|nr:T9SS type A sorting domain-containing protein [Ignavibacteriales bacterium]